jgi:hypothetical protein
MTRISIVLFSFILSACATTKQYFPMGTPDNLTPGNALIKVERRYQGVLGIGRSVEIADDGKVVGQVSAGEHLIWQRPAGDFQLQLVSAFGIVSNPIPLKVTAEPGKQYDFVVFYCRRDGPEGWACGHRNWPRRGSMVLQPRER